MKDTAHQEILDDVSKQVSRSAARLGHVQLWKAVDRYKHIGGVVQASSSCVPEAKERATSCAEVRNPLQQRVFKLFGESLDMGGFLCLGTKESLRFSGNEESFDVVNRSLRIFRKRQMRPNA